MPKTQIRMRPIEALEAFCCSQVERIETTFAHRYGMDYMTDTRAAEHVIAPGNRYHVMPQNDAMTRKTLMRDGLIEVRGRI